MRRAVGTWLAGLVLAIFALGVTVLPLKSAPFTEVLSRRFSMAHEAGLTPDEAIELAERVRDFVVSGGGELPAVVAGRPGFDAAAVSHLTDVRSVLLGAQIATVGLAFVVAISCILLRRNRVMMADALKAGALLTLAIPLLTGLAGLVDFDALFGAFHSLFFSAGTWAFPYDSLLIRLFPEPFWMWAGGCWAALIALSAAIYGVAGMALARVGRAVPERANREVTHKQP